MSKQTLSVTMSMLIFLLRTAAGEAQVQRKDDPQFRRSYIYISGSYTRSEALTVARNYGGKLLVLTLPVEFDRIVRRFWKPGTIIHIGHYQLSGAPEPGRGWVTVTGENGYWPWNGDGPEDGVRKKWGWSFSDEGLSIFYGPSNGKNEDCAVIWKDNGGKLEDVSCNQRAGLIVEVPWR